MKIQKKVAGDIAKISLDGGMHSYVRVLGGAEYAFYDYFSELNIPIDDIVNLPVIFRIFVMDYAIKKGRWLVVGHESLSGDLADTKKYFIQDAIDKDKYSLYEGGKIIPDIKENCYGLERAAVWDPDHVEERLMDHFLGRPNKWVEFFRLK